MKQFSLNLHHSDLLVSWNNNQSERNIVEKTFYMVYAQFIKVWVKKSDKMIFDKSEIISLSRSSFKNKDLLGLIFSIICSEGGDFLCNHYDHLVFLLY